MELHQVEKYPMCLFRSRHQDVAGAMKSMSSLVGKRVSPFPFPIVAEIFESSVAWLERVTTFLYMGCTWVLL